MSDQNRQTEIFGQRREPHTIIIAQGNNIRHFTLRPWMAATFGTVIFAFAIGYLMATSYLVLRDDLIGASIARQARMQHAYEDRIAALRSQMDRIISRQLLDQQEMETKVAQLIERQETLAERNARIGPLLDRATTGATTGALSVPTPSANPREAALNSNSKTLSQFVKSSRFGNEKPLGTGHQAADASDKTFSAISSSLKAIEATQIAKMTVLADDARYAGDTIKSAMSNIGIKLTEPEASDTASGGPLIAMSEAIDQGYYFEETVRGLDDALLRLDELRDQAKQAPLLNPVAGKSISSRFGLRRDPLLGSRAFHSGTDFRAATGTNVRATGPGQVVSAGWNGGYGRMVEIRHPSGHVTRYAHLSRISVRKGESVQPGEIIGKVGSSGRSTGPHLHYEVRLGKKPQNPEKFFGAGKKIEDFL